MTTDERFWSKVDRTADAENCWLWKAGRDRHGYGLFYFQGRHHGAHRIAYILTHGDRIAAGLDIDHLCRVRLCVNPAHLEPVTRRVNLLRGNTITARNAAKTHCPYGHAYSSNLTGKGARYCAECARLRMKSRRDAKAADMVPDWSVIR